MESAQLQPKTDRTFKITGSIALGLLLLLLVRYQLRAEYRAVHSEFYTTDDGQTWFAADASNLAPFDHDGKQAVQAFVYQSNDGKKFVDHLMRYTPQAKQLAAARIAAVSKNQPLPKEDPSITRLFSGPLAGMEVKRPGDADWISTADMAKASIAMTVKSSNRENAATEVIP